MEIDRVESVESKIGVITTEVVAGEIPVAIVISVYVIYHVTLGKTYCIFLSLHRYQDSESRCGAMYCMKHLG